MTTNNPPLSPKMSLQELEMYPSVYINPYTDFGFKKLFGEPAAKPQLMDFLNSLLPEKHQIQDLTFKDKEQLANGEIDRRAIYDIYCESTSGEKFIVEMQRNRQYHFKDRALYYATFPIAEQIPKGEPVCELKAIYCISILDFILEPKFQSQEVIHRINLRDEHNRLFYDKLNFIYIEMPNFNKTEQELETQLDKWLYFIKNLVEIEQIPAIFKGVEVFEQAFATAQYIALSPSDRHHYERNLKIMRDNMGEHLQALADGKAIGIAEGLAQAKLDIARSMLEETMPLAVISKLTGLSIDELKQL